MQAFGDSFDYYASINDAAGYWDSIVTTNWSLATGRFPGSRALNCGNQTNPWVKSSGQNDAVHHIIFAFFSSALSGTTLGQYFQFGDGTNAQCSIVVRSDGAILLTSGGPGGAALATYTGAWTQGAWNAFECEVVIHNTAGSVAIRKNGNTVNDFSASSLNTRAGSTNNYANRLTIGAQSAGAPWNTLGTYQLDDVLWRSDPTAVPWAGDIRSYQLLPNADVSAQFSKSPTVVPLTPYVAGLTLSTSAGQARYGVLTPTLDGQIGSMVLSWGAGITGNVKCSIFASSGSAPTTVLGSATPVNNPGNIVTFTFPTPVSVTKGTQYYVGFIADAANSIWGLGNQNGNLGLASTSVSYASFPQANPGGLSSTGIPVFTANITPTGNCGLVSEIQQDSSTTYVYDSTVGHGDLYSIQGLPVTPPVIACVTLRGYMAKSDAGSRSGQLQLKSGGTTVQSSPLVLGTNFQWNWRTDLTDPNTSAAWTPAAVNNLQIGPVVQA